MLCICYSYFCHVYSGFQRFSQMTNINYIEKYRLHIGFSLWVVALLLLTCLDNLIHSGLYSYNLVSRSLLSEPAWFTWNQLVYGGLWQFTLFTLLLIHKSWMMFAFQQVFYWSASQDLVFYLVWEKGTFPSGNWAWMWWQCKLFGSWNTWSQLTLTFLVMSIFIIVWIIRR